MVQATRFEKDYFLSSNLIDCCSVNIRHVYLCHAIRESMDRYFKQDTCIAFNPSLETQKEIYGTKLKVLSSNKIGRDNTATE